MAEKPAAHTPGEGSRRILNRFPTVSEANDAEEASDHRIASVPFRLMPDGTPSLRPGRRDLNAPSHGKVHPQTSPAF